MKDKVSQNGKGAIIYLLEAIRETDDKNKEWKTRWNNCLLNPNISYGDTRNELNKIYFEVVNAAKKIADRAMITESATIDIGTYYPRSGSFPIHQLIVGSSVFRTLPHQSDLSHTMWLLRNDIYIGSLDNSKLAREYGIRMGSSRPQKIKDY